MLFPDTAKTAISNAFYDKEVSILDKSEQYDSEGGLKKASKSIKSTFLGNVRFITYGEKQSEKGLLQDLDAQITCPTDIQVAVDDILQFKGVKYVAVDVLPYDSHLLISVKKWRGQ